MAAFTSKATGNWSASGQTTWNESGVPGNGDTVAIGAGHVITVTANATVGTSPASGTNAITIANTGKLIINTGVTLTVRGDCTVTGSGSNVTHVQMNAGSTWKFDGSLASSPSTAIYRLKLGAGYYTYPQLEINGTSGSRCTFTSDSGGANGAITNGGFLGGSVDAEFCDFSRLGSASVSAFLLPQYQVTAVLSLVDCTVNTCGKIETGNSVGGGAVQRFQRTKFTNSLHADYNLDGGATGALTTGVMLIDGCSFDKSLFIAVRDFTITNNYFHEVFTTLGSYPWVEFSNNFIRDPAAAARNVHGDVDNCYWLEDHADGNPHGMGPATEGDCEITNNVIASSCATGDQAGDMIMPPAWAAPHTCRVTGNIVLANAGGDNIGKLVSLLGNANVTVEIEHNTYFTVGLGETAVTFGETYAGHAGMISRFRSNLAWGPGSSGMKLGHLTETSTPTDLADPDFVDYNAGWGIAAGSLGGGYNETNMTAPMFTGTRGVDWAVNDIDGVDPQFIDPTRCLETWGAAIESTDGSLSQALAVLADDPSKIAGMISWVRTGFTPTNPAYETAGHDGVAPGAISYVAAPPGSGGGGGGGSLVGGRLVA